MLAWLGLLSSAWAQAPEPPLDEAALFGEAEDAETRTIWFNRDLYLNSDRMLQGLAATETFHFTLPRTWVLEADPVVRLKFEHSSALIPRRSSLTVRVNDEAIASILMTPENEIGGELVTSIPRRLLRDHNALSVNVVQHISAECEDPFDPALWTRVGVDSSIDVTYRRWPIVPELLDFPYPYFDPLGFGPMEVALAGGERATAPQLDALGVLGVALGRIAAYRTVSVLEPVTDLARARSHVVVVGTAQQNPLVPALVDTRSLKSGEGLVATIPNPADPSLGVLVLTGADDLGLSRATASLVGQDRYQLLSGSHVRIGELEEPKPPPTRRDPLPFNGLEEATLADLRIEDTTVRSFYAPPVQIPIALEGDSHVRISGARVGIDYAYAAHLDNRLSSMEVRLNGVTLASVALSSPSGEEKTRLWVDLPFELFEPSSEVEAVFHLFPADYDQGPCAYISDHHLWATVFASSVLEIQRDHYADLPAIGLLRHDLWPYSEAAGDGEVVVVVSDEPDMLEASAALQVAAELGRRTAAEHPRVRIVPSLPSRLSETADSHSILLVGDRRHSSWDGLVSARALTAVGGSVRSLQTPQGEQLRAEVGTAYDTIEQIVHPDNPQRTVLALRSSGSRQLGALVGLLSDSERLHRLEGQAAVLSFGGGVRTIIAAAGSDRVGHNPLSSRFQHFVRGSWPLLGLGVLLSSIIITWLIRTWAARRGGQT